MKIAILTSYWNPPNFRGGISRVVYELRKIWIEEGHTVHIFASETKTDKKKGIFKVPIPTTPLRGLWISFYLATFKKLESYDIIFPQNIVKCTFLDKGKCIPFIHTLSESEHKIPWRFWQYFLKPVEKFVVKKLKASITLSAELNNSLITRYGYKGTSILKTYNGVDYNTFLPKKQVSKDIFTVLTAGRFIPRKRFDLLIRAFSLFSKVAKNTFLIIAGDGYLRDKYKTLVYELDIQDKVFFPGAVDGNRMVQLYQTASIFALPSASEGMPMVVLEAQSAGLPVLISNFETSREIIEDSKTGFIIPSDDPECWKENFDILYSNQSLRDRLGIQARNRIIAHFSWDAIAKRIIDYFEMFLNNDSRQSMILKEALSENITAQKKMKT